MFNPRNKRAPETLTIVEVFLERFFLTRQVSPAGRGNRVESGFEHVGLSFRNREATFVGAVVLIHHPQLGVSPGCFFFDSEFLVLGDVSLCWWFKQVRDSIQAPT